MQLPNLWKPTEVFGSTFSPMRRDLDELFNKIKWPDLPINIGSNGPALNVAEHKNNFIMFVFNIVI